MLGVTIGRVPCRFVTLDVNRGRLALAIVPRKTIRYSVGDRLTTSVTVAPRAVFSAASIRSASVAGVALYSIGCVMRLPPKASEKVLPGASVIVPDKVRSWTSLVAGAAVGVWVTRGGCAKGCIEAQLGDRFAHEFVVIEDRERSARAPTTLTLPVSIGSVSRCVCNSAAVGPTPAEKVRGPVATALLWVAVSVPPVTPPRFRICTALPVPSTVVTTPSVPPAIRLTA